MFGPPTGVGRMGRNNMEAGNGVRIIGLNDAAVIGRELDGVLSILTGLKDKVASDVARDLVDELIDEITGEISALHGVA
jgi:hypothetical protein